MPPQVWRITQHPGVGGLGGIFCDGRWHSKGHVILYAAEHPALALIEAMAHMDLSLDAIPDTLKLCRILLDPSLTVHKPSVPNGWQANQVMSRKVGDAWLLARAHALCEVPSAILPHSTNYLINPMHPAIIPATVTEVEVEPLWIDERFIR